MQRRQIEWIVRRDPRGEERAYETDRKHDRGHHRHRRVAETIGEIAIPRDGERMARTDLRFDRRRRSDSRQIVHAVAMP